MLPFLSTKSPLDMPRAHSRGTACVSTAICKSVRVRAQASTIGMMLPISDAPPVQHQHHRHLAEPVLVGPDIAADRVDLPPATARGELNGLVRQEQRAD